MYLFNGKGGAHRLRGAAYCVFGDLWALNLRWERTFNIRWRLCNPPAILLFSVKAIKEIKGGFLRVRMESWKSQSLKVTCEPLLGCDVCGTTGQKTVVPIYSNHWGGVKHTFPPLGFGLRGIIQQVTQGVFNFRFLRMKAAKAPKIKSAFPLLCSVVLRLVPENHICYRRAFSGCFCVAGPSGGKSKLQSAQLWSLPLLSCYWIFSQPHHPGCLCVRFAWRSKVC